MYVYLKEPMAHAIIDGIALYGKYYARGSFGATNVSRQFYTKHKEVLEEFEITSEWLKRKFNKEFPSLAFTPKNFWTIDFHTVVEFARLLGIDYKWSSQREFTDVEKRALRRSVLARIENESKHTS